MRLRILHVIRGLANSSGTTHIVNPLAEAQAALGEAVSVFHVAKPSEASVVPDPERVTSRCFPMSVGLNNPGLSRGFAAAVSREIHDFDVVHVHAIWNFPSWWAMRCAHAAGVPYMVAPQGSLDPWAMGQNRWGKRVYGMLTELPLLRRASRLQALSEKERVQCLAAGIRAPSVVIPNGVNPRAFDVDAAPLARMLGLPEGERTLLFLSRVHPKKGLDLLLEAFARLRERHAVTLVVAGSDGGSGYLAAMQARAVALGVMPHCRFIGEVRGDEKFRLLRGADGYALLSRSEGLPVAVLEALGAGLPVVVSDECNLPEVREAGAGWVVAPEEALGALDALFSNPEEAARRALRAQALISERFTWERIAQQTVAIYREMIAERPRLQS